MTELGGEPAQAASRSRPRCSTAPRRTTSSTCSSRRASTASGQVTLVRRPHRRAVRAPGHGRLHLHAEAAPPGGRQDPRALDRPVQPRHPAAVGRQGAVRRTAFRRNGSVGARGVRRRLHTAGNPHGESPTTSRAAPSSTKRSFAAKTRSRPVSRNRSMSSSRKCARSVSMWSWSMADSLLEDRRNTAPPLTRRANARSWPTSSRRCRKFRPSTAAGSRSYIYILKLNHLVDDKIHARRSARTRSSHNNRWAARPSSADSVSAKWRSGRWRLRRRLHAAGNPDREVGRRGGPTKVYEAIVRGEDTFEAGIPKSFNVLVKEMRSLL